MGRAHIRSLLAGTAAAAVMSYGIAGHGLVQPGAHDEMAGAAAVCLLLVTLVGYAALPKPVTRRPTLVAAPARRCPAAPPTTPLEGRARASPSILQRFRN